MRSRDGTTLPELLIVVVVMAILFTLAIPPIAAWLDRSAVQAATREVGALFAEARAEAIARRQPVSVVIDIVHGIVRVGSVSGPIQERSLAAIYRVSLSATRDSMSYDARGLGLGAANLTVALARGTARDTVVVARLGRVRD